MSRLWILFCLFLLFPFRLWPQSGTQTQDFTFQISATQGWVDTGLDLQSGDVVKVSATASPAGQGASGLPACNPAGIGGAAARASALPLPSASAGALIARLHGEGSSPVLVGAGTELHIEEASHLVLGMNTTGAAICQGGVAAQVTRISAQSSASNANGTQQQTRGQQLKSQLANAAQVFMAGQFGTGKTGSTASESASSAGSSNAETNAAVPLTISHTPLDAELRKHLDSLPRRVNDQFNNLGDMLNFVIVGDQKDMQAALDAASWHVADTSNTNAVLNALSQTYDSKDYLSMPMSTLFLFGRKQDFGYEMAEPIAMVASRHHFRIWKAPFTWNGKQVWVGAGTHDIGFAKDKRNNSVTHKIDPAVDGERDNIGSSLQKSNKTKTLTYYLPPGAVQLAKNATGDEYHSDGRLLVVFLP